MKGTEYTTKEEVLKRAEEAIGKSIKEIDQTGRIKTGKGAIGTIVEESWFGYKPNSESEPDFPEAGVELKVIPYKKTQKDEIRAKERLVCNIINYMEEYKKTFKTSSFWHKCETMLIMTYEHIKEIPKSDYVIDKAVLFNFPTKDLVIIEKDWEIITNKIRNGEAHLISEGDTMYLAACTKGADSSTVREQPFSDVKAKQRAYSLKNSYMTQILSRYVFGNEENECIISDWKLLQKTSFEDVIISKLRPYFGMTSDEIKRHFSVETNAKNLNEVLLGKMLGIKGKTAYTEEFQKASIIPKTIRVQNDGTIKENMSFPTFDFIKLSNEKEWEESELYNYLAPTKFLFVIFKENDEGKYIFERVMFWNIPVDDLEEVHKVWEKTVNLIKNNNLTLIQTSQGISNNLPKKSENRVSHVRPHGKNADDKLPLPDGRMMTKQCFWLNNTYIQEQIQK